MKKHIVMAVLMLLSIVLLGCGGGGGSTNGSTGTQASGRSAAIEAARSMYAFNVGGSVGGSGRSFDSGRGIKKYASLALTGVQKSRDWNYDPDLDLYYQAYEVSSTQIRVDFKTTSGVNAGYLTVTLTDGEPYPVSIRLDMDVTTRGNRVAGRSTITLYDEYGSRIREVAAWSTSRPKVSFKYDLTYTSTSVTGTFSATGPGGTVTYTNIRVDSSSFRADYNVNGATGTVVNYADGSGSVTANASDGTYTLTWDSSYNCTLRYPDGHTEDLGNLSSL